MVKIITPGVTLWLDKLEELFLINEELEFEDEVHLDLLIERAWFIHRNAMPSNSVIEQRLKKAEANFQTDEFFTSRQERVEHWEKAKKIMKTNLILMRDEISFKGREVTIARKQAQPASNETVGDQIFIVHGHDEEMKSSVARFVEKIGLTPIILHERPDGGKTIIEKFESNADVSFAIVLLSPDDRGYAVKDGSKKESPRARQNVIMELGYFIGRLGRPRVVALYKDVEGFEIPSDYQGVLFKPYRKNWEHEIVKELKNAGFSIDANLLFL